jgi:polyferredoxin
MEDKIKEACRETVTNEPIMIMEEDETLVNSFFTGHQMEVPDNGFTHRVMRNLPKSSWQKNRIWTIFCIVLGVVLLYYGKVWHTLLGTISGLWADASTNMIYQQNPLMIYLTVIALLMTGGYMVVTSERFR